MKEDLRPAPSAKQPLWVLLLLFAALLVGGQARSGEKVEALPDVLLVDRAGNERHLFSEITGDRTVVMNFIFTDCSAACPISTAIMKSVRTRLNGQGDSGKSVVLVSVSINPWADTPQRLAEFARRHGATGKGWFWLTGAQREVDRLLLAAHSYTAEASEHPSVILIGRPDVGQWTPLYGFPKAEAILDQVSRYQGKEAMR